VSFLLLISSARTFFNISAVVNMNSELHLPYYGRLIF
jgi:hypothetical protein